MTIGKKFVFSARLGVHTGGVLMRRVLVVLLAVLGLLGSMVAVAAAAKPVLEPMYANDTVVYMSAPANAVGAGGANTAQDFYVIAYPVVPAGVNPLCDFSCPDPPGTPRIHDVVLNGSPGFGTEGTAGAFNPHWHVLALAYSPKWLNNPDFHPARSVAELDAGEAAGHFLPINTVGDNRFELDTHVTFVCVLVSSHA